MPTATKAVFLCSSKYMTDKILELTKKLMDIHSTKEHPEELDRALDVIKAEINGDFQMEEFESNETRSILVHNAEKGTKNFKIIFNAHVDIVHGSRKQFTNYEKDGKLYGRGGYDMKAAAAVMTLVFKKLARNLPYPIALQVVTDEEIGGFNGTHYQLKKGVRADFTITGDCGSNLNIVSEAKGIMWLKIHATGKKAHGAYLWRGENALWKIHNALASLHKVFPVPSEEAWITTMNLAKIETDNSTFNHVPEGATAYLDFRFIPEDEKTIMEKIISAITPDIEIETLFCNSPEYIAPDNPFVKKLQAAKEEVTGEKAELISLHAPSDIRHYNDFGCVGVGFGALGAHQHANDEWVDIQSLKGYYRTLEQFLLSI
jgi:succinyl-diaminopimelate desuccinylase